MAKIVKATSKGYNYNYASLSDIANQGYEIPKMKVGTDDINQRDYVFYWDKELKEWIKGAEIVLAEVKGGNKAQIYGSSLTYARRYTTCLALGIATGDDENLEQAPKETKKTYCTKEQAEQVRKLLNQEQLNEMFKYYKINCVEALTVQQASAIIKKGATK